MEEKSSAEAGDCRQELVFVGIGLNLIASYVSLQECLLTDEELSQKNDAWTRFVDPFPQWN